MAIKPIHSLTDMLTILNRGKFAEKCDEHLAKALETLEALPGEKGTATLSLTITIAYDGGRVDIRPAIKSKLPEDKAFGETPFWTVEHGLSVQHPSQLDMAFGPRETTARRETA